MKLCFTGRILFCLLLVEERLFGRGGRYVGSACDGRLHRYREENRLVRRLSSGMLR